MIKKKTFTTVLNISLIISLVFLSFYLGGLRNESTGRVSAQDRRPSPKAQEPQFVERLHELDPEERVNVQVYEKCNRSVVNIDTKMLQRISLFSSLAAEIEAERGSGIVLDQKGHILTNYHVIEGAESIQVTLFNGNSYPAEKIGDDSRTDIAVLKVDAPPEELHPVIFADSSRLLVGQKVFAIGNPFGLERTLTSGIISSLNRTIGSRERHRPIKQVIQIDAAINPGNSGGPLLDSKARMIGMNTAIASRVGENSGVGFAIPSNTIQRIITALMKEGKVLRAEIGIPALLETPEGLLVRNVSPEGPAERGGLQGPKVVRKRSVRGGITFTQVYTDSAAADLIIAVDEQKVKTAADFFAIIEERKPGDRILITVQREGKTVKIPVVLD